MQVSNHEGGLNNQATALEQRGGQRLKGKMTAEYGAVELFHNVELTFSSKDEEGTLSQSVRQYDVMAFASGGCLIALEAKMSGTDRDVTKFSTAMSHARYVAISKICVPTGQKFVAVVFAFHRPSCVSTWVWCLQAVHYQGQARQGKRCREQRLGIKVADGLAGYWCFSNLAHQV